MVSRRIIFKHPAAIIEAQFNTRKNTMVFLDNQNIVYSLTDYSRNFKIADKIGFCRLFLSSCCKAVARRDQISAFFMVNDKKRGTTRLGDLSKEFRYSRESILTSSLNYIKYT